MGNPGIYGQRKFYLIAKVAADGALADDSVLVDDVEDSLKTMKMTISCLGTFAENSFPFNEITKTNQASTFAKILDGSSYANLSEAAGEAGYASNFQMFPTTEVTGDAIFFGAAAPFGALYTDAGSGTGGTYTGDAITWKYWNGTTWAALTIIYDFTDSTAQDGKRPFHVDGYTIFSAPTDWASTTVDSKAGYWIKALNTGTAINQVPIMTDEHAISSTTIGSEVPFDCTIGRGRFQWKTSAGSTANSTVVLCNLTSGAASAEKTLTKGKKAHEVANFNLTCSEGDVIALFGADKDGSAEFADGMLTLELTRT